MTFSGYEKDCSLFFYQLQFLFYFTDTQPWKLKDIARQVILDNVFKSKDSVPSMEDLEVLDGLPLPSLLIKYLKYFRDPKEPKPVIRTREHSSEVDSDDSSDEEGGGRADFEVVFNIDDDDNDDDDEDDDDGGGDGDGVMRPQFRIVLR